MRKNPRQLLDAAASIHVPDDTYLYPQIYKALTLHPTQRSDGRGFEVRAKTFMQLLRSKPAFMILTIFLALVLLSSVAYAVGRSLGYIPEVGMVGQGEPLRVLAEPVTTSRDEIRLTVTNAILTSDKSVILFTLENIPWGTYSHDENDSGCSGTPELHLPNGAIMQIIEGGGRMHQMRFVFAPIPANVNEATFFLPCIMNTMPDLAPENWELTLHFIPAPPELTVVPVVEIPTSMPVTETTPTTIPFTITQALQVDEDIALLGSIQQSKESVRLELRQLIVTDAFGHEVFITSPTLEGLPNFDWGMQFKSAGLAYPLELSFEGIEIRSIANSTAEFEFDTGENPQPGQVWTFNQPIQIGTQTVNLESIFSDGQNGYNFLFAADPSVTGLSLEIAGYTAIGGGGGGNDGEFSVGVMFPELPRGKLRVIFSDLKVASALQTWRMQWSPENTSQNESLFGIRLVVDKSVPLENGYFLIGHIEWDDKRIQSISEAEEIHAIDAEGKELVFKRAKYSEAVTLVEELHEWDWVYWLKGTEFHEPITFRLEKVNIMFDPAAHFSFDLGHYGFEFRDEYLDNPYKTGISPLNIPGLITNAFKVAYIKEDNLYGFEISIESDSRLERLIFSFESGLCTSNLEIVDSNDSYRDEENSLLKSRVLTNAKICFPVTLATSDAVISGEWKTTW